MKLEVLFTKDMKKGNINLWDSLQGNDIIIDIYGDDLSIAGKPVTIPEILTLLRNRHVAEKEFTERINNG